MNLVGGPSMSSMQHKLDRVRRPRVQITYDVETNGAMRKVELPFVVGVLADLSGKPKEALKELRERQVAKIDRDNFNDVMKKAAPRLSFSVPDKISGQDQKLPVELNFRSIDDFEPGAIAEQLEPTKELLAMRRNLKQLLSKMEGKPQVEKLLNEILTNKDKAAEVAKALGIEATGAGEGA